MGDPEHPVEARLPWPLFTIDFEASGLGEFTYPIEIGIACWPAPNLDIETWSTLIKPPEEWFLHRIWNAASEEVHGIHRHELAHGATPAGALAHANKLIGSHVAFCDGGEHDLRWLLHLAHAAGIPPSFHLADWDALGGALTPSQYAAMINWCERQATHHRAGEDAERLMRALAAGLTS